ncbi:MAG: COX15/CtaA family protein [Acidobacteriota bacterium]|nr:COX15/CtaA family protein [Acidobacteriota bacterium]
MSAAPQTRNRLARFAWSVLGFNLLVIVWGAVVRATGSGAGCGSHWPLCNGEVVPLEPATETLIELFHRATSGIALLLVIALTVAVFRAFPKGHVARRAAMASLILIFIEALIGAGLVLFELVGDNDSMARAVYIAAHLTNTLLLVGALTLTARFSAPDRTVTSQRHWGHSLLWISFLGALLAAVSGAIAALGDTLFPPETLGQALAQDVSSTGHLLVRLRTFHPLIAIGAGLVMLVLARRQLESPYRSTRTQRDARLLMFLVLLQMTGGVINVALLAPIWMQVVHLLMADLMWIALVLLAESLTTEPLKARPRPPVETHPKESGRQERSRA